MAEKSGLIRVRPIIKDKNFEMHETIPEVFLDTRYQRCTVRFYRSIFSVTPHNKMKAVAMILKTIHAQESKETAHEKAQLVAEKLKGMKFGSVAKSHKMTIEETLTYVDFQHSTESKSKTITPLNN